MTANIIDGKQIAADLRASTKELVTEFIDKYNKAPTLAVVLVGERYLTIPVIDLEVINESE